MIKNIFLLTTALFLTSCASYIDNAYRELERSEFANNQMSEDDYFTNHYRPNQNRKTSSVYNKPKGRHALSTNSQKNLDPQVKRQYVDEKVAARRVTASDFTDRSSEGSLWGDTQNSTFLFTSSRSKKSGDIVQINVLNKLKNEISQELRRAFPDNPYDAKGKDSAQVGDIAAANNPAQMAGQIANNSTDSAEVSEHDKISGVVVEEINREHLLIKGRKNVVYKNKKRMVEVQALVSRRDISDNDSLDSDAIIESNVSVVR